MANWLVTVTEKRVYTCQGKTPEEAVENICDEGEFQEILSIDSAEFLDADDEKPDDMYEAKKKMEE